MRPSLSILALLLALVPACDRGGGGSAPAVAPAYRTDLDNICNAEERSGALAPDQAAPRHLAVAQWLGPTIQTAEGRSFLAGLSKLAPAAKGARLRSESTRVGLAACPLADSWK
jgi:hypothetical protein